MKPKLLITGGSGLVGSYLIRWFSQQGYSEITATYHSSKESIPQDILSLATWRKLSLPDSEDVFGIVDDHDWVIHCAGLVSYHPSDKYRLLDINRTGTEQIVNACLKHPPAHLVYVGSISALGRELDHTTLHEDAAWVDNNFSTNYGLSKYLGELEVWRGSAEGLNVSVVLPSIILGAGAWHRSSLQMVDRVATKSGWYPGGQTGMVDVRDVVRFISHLLVGNLHGQRWILNGGDITYKEVYHILGQQLNPAKSFRLAPLWLARAILTANQWLGSGGPGTEILNHTYGTFSYDATKSLQVDGFSYRDIRISLAELARVYHEKGSNPVLPF